MAGPRQEACKDCLPGSCRALKINRRYRTNTVSWNEMAYKELQATCLSADRCTRESGKRLLKSAKACDHPLSDDPTKRRVRRRIPQEIGEDRSKSLIEARMELWRNIVADLKVPTKTLVFCLQLFLRDAPLVPEGMEFSDYPSELVHFFQVEQSISPTEIVNFAAEIMRYYAEVRHYTENEYSFEVFQRRVR